MCDRNTENENARSGRAVTDDQPAADRDPGGHVGEPKSYAAPDKRDATLAQPAASEMTDYADEGHASGGAQQGRTRTNAAARDVNEHQGDRTRARQKQIIQDGLPPERA